MNPMGGNEDALLKLIEAALVDLSLTACVRRVVNFTPYEDPVLSISGARGNRG